MEPKNWNWCRQARWENGDKVEVYSLYTGKHLILVKAMGIEISFEVPSYAGLIQYEKWVEEIQYARTLNV